MAKLKEITFTSEERILLEKILKERQEIYLSELQSRTDKKGRKSFEAFYMKPLISVLEKISKNEPDVYLKREKQTCVSCINGHLDEFYKELDLEDSVSWLTISDWQKQVVKKLDSCHDMLVKCGYKTRKETLLQYNPEFRYRDTLTTIEKLKASDTIFLSGEKVFYKIAFVHEQKELLTFELKNKILIYHVKFSLFDGEPYKEYGKKYFSRITTKEEASKLLASCPRQYYPEGVLDFIDGILN